MPVALLAAVLALTAVRGDAAPVARDRYGHMHMKFERTWLGIDVANIDVSVDEATRGRFRELAVGQHYSEPVAERIARTALQAEDVDVQVQFLRRASLKEFLDAARNNLAHARDAGYISQGTFASAWQGVQRDFSALAKRGFKSGDRLVYRARPGSLQTTVLSAGGVLLDVTTYDAGARRAMIASYFAPGSDFRKGLIKDLLR